MNLINQSFHQKKPSFISNYNRGPATKLFSSTAMTFAMCVSISASQTFFSPLPPKLFSILPFILIHTNRWKAHVSSNYVSQHECTNCVHKTLQETLPKTAKIPKKLPICLNFTLAASANEDFPIQTHKIVIFREMKARLVPGHLAWSWLIKGARCKSFSGVSIIPITR